MTKSSNDKPFSMAPLTDDIDDLWAEVDFGPAEKKTPAKAPSDPFGLEDSGGSGPNEVSERKAIAPDFVANVEPSSPEEALVAPAPPAFGDATFDDGTGAIDISSASAPGAIDLDEAMGGLGAFEEPSPEPPAISFDELPLVDGPSVERRSAEFGSPEESDVQAVPRPPGRRVTARTAPEPVVRRHVEQMNARSEPPADLSFGDDAASPLSFGAEGSAMDLVENSLPPDRGEFAQAEEAAAGSSASDLQDRYAVGDFTGALVIAESILETNPHDEDALRYAASCREVLTQMYAARLGPLDRIAQVAIPPEQITWLSLDHRAGFLLSLVDGNSTVEDILDISGMSRLEALRIMYTLVQQNVISVV